MQHRGYTVDQIAAQVGVSAHAVRHRTGIDRYLIGTLARGGRPAKIYDPDVLTLWLRRERTEPTTVERKVRTDWGVPRNCTPQVWAAIVEAVRGLYVASAQDNLKLACEQAEKDAAAGGIRWPLSANQVYRRLARKDLAPDGLAISDYYRDNWQLIRQSGLKKKSVALEMATARYNWPEIWESAGWAGAGFGALRMWSIDVRTSDAWTRHDHTGKAELSAAIYIRCALTGYPIWVEPIEQESSEAIIGAVLKAMIAWRRAPDLGYVIDNGKAMISHRTTGVLKSTLPYGAYERAAAYPELFGLDENGRPSPILKNLPNIPRSPFKASLERSFKLIKDEFDATRFARSYQGGNRAESVQLRVSNMPVWTYLPESLRATGTYFGTMADWLYSDYIHRARPSMFPTFVERGMTPSMDCVFRYYYDPLPNLPDGERLAYLLYWAADQKAIVTARLGYADATIGGEFWHCVSAKLDHHYHHQKVAIVPIPASDCAVLMLANDEADPRYLATVRNAYVRHIGDMQAIRDTVAQTQNTIRTGLRDERSAVPAREWRNMSSAAEARPQLVEAWVDGQPTTIEEVMTDTEPRQLSSDVAELIQD